MSDDATSVGWAFDAIETSGGWRLVMQGRMEPFESAAEHVEHRHMFTHPHAYLGLAFFLARRSETRKARRLIDELWAAFRAGQIPGRESLRAELPLVDVHIRFYEDRPMGEAELRLLQGLLTQFPPDDPISRAVAMNHLCTVALHLGNFNFSQGYGENAIRAYVDGGAEFGALHLHAHVGQIRLARGDLVGAEREYQLMSRKLEKIEPKQRELVSICHTLRSEVAYEMNEIEKSQALLDSALLSVEDDGAWLDVLAAGYRVSTRLAMHHWGLPGALTALAHAETIATRRGMPRLHRLIQVEKIRALTLSDELDSARSEIRHAGLDRFTEIIEWDGEADWTLRLGSTAVALARFLILVRRADQALVLLNAAEDNAIRSGHMLAVAKLRVIRALALWRLRQQGEAINALVSAVRLLGKQPFRRFILDEGLKLQEIVQAALDGDHLEARSNQSVRRRLRELNHHWTLQQEQSEKSGKQLRGKQRSGREQYLQLLAVGQSNKEIGRALGVSQNTVKYHLKIIFKELGVDNRVRAVNRARDLGML